MATAKQLAALKKARAAREKNLAKKAPVKKTVAKKATPKKRATKRKTVRKTNPVTQYVVTVKTVKGDGYLSDWTPKGPHFDDDIHRALTFPGHRLAAKMQNAIYTLKPRGVRSVDIRIVGHVPVKKR